MTALVDLCNRSLQVIGTRTTVTSAELLANSSNEAIQFNLLATPYRRQLLRMAPWDCSLRTANLTYITSSPGTPENTSGATNLWQPGQPRPPWAYEYQWPVDCVRDCWIIPATQTGFAGGIPVTTAVTGGAPSFWQSMPISYKIGTDLFYPVTAATSVSLGLGYAVGDLITLAQAPQGSPPLGAPAVLQVASVGASGQCVAVAVVSQVFGEATPVGGSYFAIQSNSVAQGSTTGSGSGATFNLTQSVTQSPQRVILTNQEFATLVYVSDVTDANVWDDQFQEAYVNICGAGLIMALTGDKNLANMKIKEANRYIEEARKSDANDGFTVNDVTPDWIRTRGIQYDTEYTGPFSGFDWGMSWPLYG